MDHSGIVFNVSERQHPPNLGYIVEGATNSFGTGDWDFLVAKIEVAGGNPYIAWAKTYGGVKRDLA